MRSDTGMSTRTRRTVNSVAAPKMRRQKRRTSTASVSRSARQWSGFWVIEMLAMSDGIQDPERSRSVNEGEVKCMPRTVSSEHTIVSAQISTCIKGSACNTVATISSVEYCASWGRCGCDDWLHENHSGCEVNSRERLHCRAVLGLVKAQCSKSLASIKGFSTPFNMKEVSRGRRRG